MFYWNTKASLTHSQVVYDFNHTHAFVSVQWSWFFDKRTTYRPRNRALTRGGEWFPIVIKCWKMIQPVPIKAVLLPAKAATLYWNPLPPPLPHLFTRTKPIFKTACTNWYHTAKVRQCQKVSSVVKWLNICGLQYVNFLSLKATLIVAILQVPDDKGILVTANYGQMQSACMEYKWMCYNGRLGGLLTLQLSTMQSKRHCSVSLSCDLCKTHCILLACVPFSALRTTLIVAISVWQRQWIKYLLFECTILLLFMIASYAWANIKHIATRICYKNRG